MGQELYQGSGAARERPRTSTMQNLIRRPRWSPTLVGAGIGVLSWITFLAMDKQLGVSTTFVRAAAALERSVAPEHVAANSYLASHVKGTGLIDWQFALVLAPVSLRMLQTAEATYRMLAEVAAP